MAFSCGRHHSATTDNSLSLLNQLGDVFVVGLSGVLEIHTAPEITNRNLPSAVHPLLAHDFPGGIAAEISVEVRLLGIKDPEIDSRIPKQ